MDVPWMQRNMENLKEGQNQWQILPRLSNPNSKKMRDTKNKIKCFKCNQDGQVSRVCPKHNEQKEPPRVVVVKTIKVGVPFKGLPISYV